jgi:flagellar hook assembly protein FlgD
LVEDAHVKITDINGRLVYQTTAHGGQAVWDGKTKQGEPAQSGVYLVFSTDERGESTFATKILIIN